MYAPTILLAVAAVLVVAALWNVARHGGRITVAARTWLIVAAIFVAVTTYLRVVRKGP
jgi:hypothetical protein